MSQREHSEYTEENSRNLAKLKIKERTSRNETPPNALARKLAMIVVRKKPKDVCNLVPPHNLITRYPGMWSARAV